jgi:single-strand DNA-binding protein
MNLNKVILIGKLTRDSEIREIKDGMKICKLNMMVEHSYKFKDGQEKKEVCFIDVNVWNKEFIASEASSLQENDELFVEGRLKSEKWTDKETGKDRYKTVVEASVVMLINEKTQQTKPSLRAVDVNDFMKMDFPKKNKVDDLPF